jgi:hypothetical protein
MINRMTPEDNQCEKNFQDLIDKKCIVISQIIEESDACDYFRAVPPNKIQYHPDMKGIHRNSITFCILHEENHNGHPIRTVFSFLLISALLITLGFVFHFSIVLLIPIILVLGIVLKRGEEYACDEFAASIMKKELKIQEKPSEIIGKTLEIMPSRWWSAVIHPSHMNRVNNISKRFDEN